MKQFKEVVREIKSTLTGIIFFFVFINATLIFLGLYLMLLLLDLYPMSAAIPAIFYMIIVFIREMSVNKIRIVEMYYPALNEKLRTAADYADADNEVVNELHREVMEEVHKVSASSFFNRKETTFKLSVVMLLCFAIVSATILDINLGGWQGKIKDKLQQLQGEPGDSNEFNPLGQAMGGTGKYQDIYGKRALAKLGTEELEVELKPSSYEFMIKAAGEQAEPEPFAEQFPGEVIARESENYREKTPKQRDEQDIVKRYFKNLAEVNG